MQERQKREFTFQFTPARGGRPAHLPISASFSSFNSRPHVAGDPRSSATPRPWPVSIHARTWRATALRLVARPLNDVSIHARTWRATFNDQSKNDDSMFQFTPARGGRRQYIVVQVCGCCFNSRPHVAGDDQR